MFSTQHASIGTVPMCVAKTIIVIDDRSIEKYLVRSRGMESRQRHLGPVLRQGAPVLLCNEVKNVRHHMLKS